MPRKPEAAAPVVEVIPPAPDFARHAAEFKRIVEGIVEEKLRPPDLKPDELPFEPWFRSKETAHAIKLSQSLPEQQKWTNYFADWGCLVCQSSTAAHRSLGMCARCHSRVCSRLRATVRKHAPADPLVPSFSENLKMARAALDPSVSKAAFDSSTQVQRRSRNQREAAREAGIHPDTLGHWIKTGKVQRPAKRMGKHWLWSEEDVAKLRALAGQLRKTRAAGTAAVSFNDVTDMARAALAPSIELLKRPRTGN